MNNLGLISLSAGLLATSLCSTPSVGQSYPIDCAILLCLAGGWPASVPCTKARTEFVRRVTPWPVEPPLQIWRCPMRATFDAPLEQGKNEDSRMVIATVKTLGAQWGSERNGGSFSENPIAGFALPLVQDHYRADIDISGPEFNFVRSIRVFDISSAEQRITGSDGGCERSFAMRIGQYGSQGAFRWERIAHRRLPTAHKGLEQFGLDCPTISHRSVFVEWRDYNGNYGFEQVNY